MESFHPTKYGQAQIAAAFRGEINSPPDPSFPLGPLQRVTRTVAVPAGSPGLAVNTGWPGSDVVTSLVSPSGRRIGRSTVAADVDHQVTTTSEHYLVRAPEAGLWSVEVFGADVAINGEPVTLETFAAPKPNLAPIARGTVQKTGSQITFDSTASTDPEGQALRSLWDFGDGTGANQASGTHVYTQSGTYKVHLATTDPGDLAGLATVATIVVDADAPTVSITSPTNGQSLVKGSLVAAAFSCADIGGSGLGSCVGNIPNGQPLAWTLFEM